MKKSSKTGWGIFCVIVGFGMFNSWAIDVYGVNKTGKVTAVNGTGKLYFIRYLNENNIACICKIRGWPNYYKVGDEIKIRVHPFFPKICSKQD